MIGPLKNKIFLLQKSPQAACFFYRESEEEDREDGEGSVRGGCSGQISPSKPCAIIEMAHLAAGRL